MPSVSIMLQTGSIVTRSAGHRSLAVSGGGGALIYNGGVGRGDGGGAPAHA